MPRVLFFSGAHYPLPPLPPPPYKPKPVVISALWYIILNKSHAARARVCRTLIKFSREIEAAAVNSLCEVWTVRFLIALYAAALNSGGDDDHRTHHVCFSPAQYLLPRIRYTRVVCACVCVLLIRERHRERVCWLMPVRRLATTATNQGRYVIFRRP